MTYGITKDFPEHLKHEDTSLLDKYRVSEPLEPDNPETYDSDIVHGTPEFVLAAIDEEIKYQNRKYGLNKQQSLPGYLLVLQNELDEAKAGWTKDLPGRNSVLHELVQVAAVAIRALATYGVTGSAISTNDTVIVAKQKLTPGDYLTETALAISANDTVAENLLINGKPFNKIG